MNIAEALEIGESLCASEAEKALAGEVRELREQLAQERKRLDWALRHDSFYDHTTMVFFADPAFKILHPQTRVETDNPRATIDELIAAESGD